MAAAEQQDIFDLKKELSELSKHIGWLGDSITTSVKTGVSDGIKDTDNNLSEKLDTLNNTVKTSINSQTDNLKTLIDQAKANSDKDSKKEEPANDSKMAEDQNKKVTDALKEDQQKEKDKTKENTLSKQLTDISQDNKTVFMNTNEYLSQLTRLTNSNIEAKKKTPGGQLKQSISSLAGENSMVGNLAGMFDAVKLVDPNEKRQEEIKATTQLIDTLNLLIKAEERQYEVKKASGASEEELNELKKSTDNKRETVEAKSNLLATKTGEEYVYQKEQEAKLNKSASFDFSDEEKKLLAEQIKTNMLGSMGYPTEIPAIENTETNPEHVVIDNASESTALPITEPTTEPNVDVGINTSAEPSDINTPPETYAEINPDAMDMKEFLASLTDMNANANGEKESTDTETNQLTQLNANLDTLTEPKTELPTASEPTNPEMLETSYNTTNENSEVNSISSADTSNINNEIKNITNDLNTVTSETLVHNTSNEPESQSIQTVETSTESESQPIEPVETPEQKSELNQMMSPFSTESEFDKTTPNIESVDASAVTNKNTDIPPDENIIAKTASEPSPDNQPQLSSIDTSMQKKAELETTPDEDTKPQMVYIIGSDLTDLSSKEDETKMKLQAKLIVDAIISSLLPAPQYKQVMNTQASMIGDSVKSALS